MSSFVGWITRTTLEIQGSLLDADVIFQYIRDTRVGRYGRGGATGGYYYDYPDNNYDGEEFITVRLEDRTLIFEFSEMQNRWICFKSNFLHAT